MKKYFLFLMLILPLLLITACRSSSGTTVTASQPAAAAATPVASAVTQPPGITQTGATQNNSTYNRHLSGIILNGAAYYTVRTGDTLNGIARRMYQDGSLYPLIMMVSGNVKDPDEIDPGQQLIIPDLRINMNDTTARQSINRYFLDIARIEEQRGRIKTAELIRNHTR